MRDNGATRNMGATIGEHEQATVVLSACAAWRFLEMLESSAPLGSALREAARRYRERVARVTD